MEIQYTPHSTEQLERLYAEGRISADEYETLRKSMESRPTPRRRTAESERAAPQSAAAPGFPWEVPVFYGVLWLANTAFFLLIVPVFEKIFQGFGARLPFPTLFVIKLSNLIRDPLFLLLSMALWFGAGAANVYVAKRLGDRLGMRILLVVGVSVVVGVFLILCAASLYLPQHQMPSIIKGAKG